MRDCLIIHLMNTLCTLYGMRLKHVIISVYTMYDDLNISYPLFYANYLAKLLICWHGICERYPYGIPHGMDKSSENTAVLI